MPNWHRFTPADFEYDFDRDELATHYRMATMSAKAKLTEFEIDQKVIAQADDNAAWEKPILVRRTRAASLSIPPDLAARAAFLAKLHRKPSLEEWLTRVIQERIELEEAAF
ncbi:MAG: hypothetical protein COS63_02135, partial [Anaerolineae bacterium CG06_land_8_20_14_3_00_57_67]